MIKINKIRSISGKKLRRMIRKRHWNMYIFEVSYRSRK